MKNSQLGKEFWTYEGRLVFRGDIVKDENGQFAIFTEQGISASLMSAAKFMDAVSRLPGNGGEDSDAVGAYTQVSFADAAKLLVTLKLSPKHGLASHHTSAQSLGTTSKIQFVPFYLSLGSRGLNLGKACMHIMPSSYFFQPM